MSTTANTSSTASSNATGNYFATLNAINVSGHIEKKGGFSYLSWPYAVAQLRLADASASWEVRRFNGLPFLITEAGVFVEVAVTVQGVTLSQIHPVLDGRNRSMLAPTSFDINSSIQRCLVKAIALHGLGLYIYAGEDLPQPLAEAANDAGNDTVKYPAVVAPLPGAEPRSDQRRTGPTVTGSQQAHIHKLVVETGTELKRLLAHFGVDQLKDLPAVEFIRVVRSLEQRRAA